MKTYKDKNFRVEMVKVIDSEQYLKNNKVGIVYKSDGKEQVVEATFDKLRDIEEFSGRRTPLYMYSHRSHRGWKVDGFLPIRLGKRLLNNIKVMKNKVSEFNKVKELAHEKLNEDASDIVSVILELDSFNVYKILDNYDIRVCKKVIEQLQGITVNAKKIALAITDDIVTNLNEVRGNQ